MDKFTCVMPTWKDMQDYAKKTAEAIKKSGFYPDIIIGLSRGGLVPARLLADFLHVKSILSIKVDHWGITATKDGKAEISHGLTANLKGKKVLIADDITDTGQSMELAAEHVRKLDPAQVKTATLVHLSNSKYIPDFYGQEREWAWIIFPWNYTEDMVNLIKKVMADEEKVAGDIRKKLKLNFNVDVDLKEVEGMLEHMEYLEKVKKA
ncbi:phosphoribosyltransferase [Candidatus Woesearchaeota archaeon]|nr:phosphoribosyltransferase [Candidatus Woesearchaeota archaeon]MBI2660796.1 phosphoribosyltransferase [Candidatus Woesearchaeota archaeon]